MSHRGMAVLAAAAALLLAAGPARAAGGEELFLTGNEQALWILRASGEKTFDIAVRPTSLSWKLVGRDLPGAVQAAAAVDGHVHVILTNPFAHLIIHPGDQEPVQAQSPRDARWPAGAPVLAAFQMADPNDKGSASALVVVVGDAGVRPAAQTSAARGSASQSASSPAPASRAAPAERPARPTGAPQAASAPRGTLHVFRYAQGRWAHVAEYPDPNAQAGPANPIAGDRAKLPEHPDVILARQTRVLAAAAEEMIYLYVSEPGREPRLVRWDGTHWQGLPALPPPAPIAADGSRTAAAASSAPASAPGPAIASMPAAPTARRAVTDMETVFGMVCLDRQPVLLRAVPAPLPARWRVQLATLGPPPRSAAALPLPVEAVPHEEFLLQDVRPPDGTAPWGAVDFATSPLRAARLGRQIALLWKRQDRIEMGTVDLTGQFVPPENVEVFQPEPPSGQGEDIRNYVLLGALALSSLLALVLRGRVPLRPVALPAGVAVADLFRRLAAGLIDLLPICMVARTLVSVPDLSVQEFLQFAKDQRLPNSVYYAGMGAICLYAAYCVFLEYRFGTTLGKAVLKLRVANDQGARAILAQVALRNVLKVIEILFILPGFPVLLLIPLFNRNRQRLGDLIARTVVVSGKPTAQPGGGSPHEPPRE